MYVTKLYLKYNRNRIIIYVTKLYLKYKSWIAMKLKYKRWKNSEINKYFCFVPSSKTLTQFKRLQL